jgi:hypothetical protein
MGEQEEDEPEDMMMHRLAWSLVLFERCLGELL